MPLHRLSLSIHRPSIALRAGHLVLSIAPHRQLTAIPLKLQRYLSVNSPTTHRPSTALSSSPFALINDYRCTRQGGRQHPWERRLPRYRCIIWGGECHHRPPTPRHPGTRPRCHPGTRGGRCHPPQVAPGFLDPGAALALGLSTTQVPSPPLLPHIRNPIPRLLQILNARRAYHLLRNRFLDHMQKIPSRFFRWCSKIDGLTNRQSI